MRHVPIVDGTCELLIDKEGDSPWKGKTILSTYVIFDLFETVRLMKCIHIIKLKLGGKCKQFFKGLSRMSRFEKITFIASLQKPDLYIDKNKQ